METAGRALLSRVVDYAGLFPPAARAIPDAVAEYNAARRGPDAWMLGRFVLPATRLTEFVDTLGHRGAEVADWKLSAIVRDQSEADRLAVEQFNTTGVHGIAVDSVECKLESVANLDWIVDAFRGVFEVFIEAPAGPEAPAWMDRLGARGLRAKVRTGGLTAGAFPPADALLTFVEAAVTRGVPFKATAGLHHATCGTYALTYEADAASAPMYGYLNLLLATAALRDGMNRSAATHILRAADAERLVFRDDAVQWGDLTFARDTLHDLRQHQFLSFGSCSFREPADEFRRINDGSFSTRR